METTFKYKGQIISTPNLEKKLKRMKITLDDIEIIEVPKKELKEELQELLDTHRKVCILNTIDNSKRIAFVPKDEPNPEIEKLLERFKWNPKTKTGIREITPEYIRTMYYEE